MSVEDAQNKLDAAFKDAEGKRQKCFQLEVQLKALDRKIEAMPDASNEEKDAKGKMIFDHYQCLRKFNNALFETRQAEETVQKAIDELADEMAKAP